MDIHSEQKSRLETRKRLAENTDRLPSNTHLDLFGTDERECVCVCGSTFHQCTYPVNTLQHITVWPTKNLILIKQLITIISRDKRIFNIIIKTYRKAILLHNKMKKKQHIVTSNISFKNLPCRIYMKYSFWNSSYQWI